MLVLSVIQGPDKGKRLELPDHEPQLVGRSSEALPLTDNTMSRRHAELTPDDGTWWIRDLHSQNGTYVNGVRLVERTRLRPGDQIRAGSTLIVFGRSTPEEESLVHLLPPEQVDATFERTLASNEDSMVLAEPEPRAAAIEHLKVIYKLTTLTAQTTDRARLLKSVLELVFDVFQPERGFIVLSGPTLEAPLIPAAVRFRSTPKDADAAQIRVSRTIVQHAIRHGEGVLSSNAMGDPRFSAGDSVRNLNIRSAICTPIRFQERTYGAIYIDSSIANYTFTPEQLALMNAIGQHTGLAVATAEGHAHNLQTERLAAVGEAVASLSHSIKNILQGLRGGADVVEMGLKKDDLKISRGGWDILKRNLDRIVSLTLNMLAFSRQRQVELELTKVGVVIDECSQLLESQCHAKGIALIIDVDPEMPPVPLDPALVHQALLNLMTNAVEAVPPSTGAVTVKAAYHAPGARGEGSPAMAEIAVIDNGPGIPKEKQAWIFEPFHTTKGVRGTGLGLAVTKRVVEEHRGRIRVESGGGGRGATFRLLFPADAKLLDPSATAGAKPDFTSDSRG